MLIEYTLFFCKVFYMLLQSTLINIPQQYKNNVAHIIYIKTD